MNFFIQRNVPVGYHNTNMVLTLELNIMNGFHSILVRICSWSIITCSVHEWGVLMKRTSNYSWDYNIMIENVNMGMQHHNNQSNWNITNKILGNFVKDITPLQGFQTQEWLYQFLSRISHHQPLSANNIKFRDAVLRTK